MGSLNRDAKNRGPIAKAAKPATAESEFSDFSACSSDVADLNIRQVRVPSSLTTPSLRGRRCASKISAFSEAWPRLMRAETAARYVDEISVEAFRRAVGSLYPQPIRVSGKGDRWLREGLDEAINRIARKRSSINDAADVL
jgi:hypothetical protein